MRKTRLSICLRRALAGLTLIATSGLAAAQQAPASGSASTEAESTSADKLETVEVKGEIVYRDRSEAIAPTLSYDLEYQGNPRAFPRAWLVTQVEGFAGPLPSEPRAAAPRRRDIVAPAG